MQLMKKKTTKILLSAAMVTLAGGSQRHARLRRR